jgi:hypothetical protein
MHLRIDRLQLHLLHSNGSHSLDFQHSQGPVLYLSPLCGYSLFLPPVLNVHGPEIVLSLGAQ